MNLLEIDNIHKSYGDLAVLRGVSLRVDEAMIVGLLGPSGCGKTTLLRIVAGLEHADSGSLRYAGMPIDRLPAHARGFGMMFQDYALFPHLDVAANVAFGLRMRSVPQADLTRRVAEVLDLVGLSGFARRRVYDLSGGERQRVALARALAPQPRLLLLDEPLSALDRTLRERLQDELRSVLRQVGLTTLYVTHDQEEAFALSDLVVLLNAGAVEQSGPPEAIYRRPASLWAAGFLGMYNRLSGIYRGNGIVETALGNLAATTLAPLADGVAVTVVIAPDAAQDNTGPGTAVSGTMTELQFRGRYYRVSLRCASDLLFDLDMEEPPGSIGAVVRLMLDPARVLVYLSDDSE